MENNVSRSPIRPEEGASSAGRTVPTPHDPWSEDMIMDAAWMYPNESSRCPDLLSSHIADSSLFDLPSWGGANVRLQSSHDFIPSYGYEPTMNIATGLVNPIINWNNHVPHIDVAAGAAQSPRAASKDLWETNDNMALESLDYMSPSKEPRMPLGLRSVDELRTMPGRRLVASDPCASNTSAGIPCGTMSEVDTTTIAGPQRQRSRASESSSEQHVSTLRERNRVAAAKCRTKKMRERA